MKRALFLAAIASLASSACWDAPTGLDDGELFRVHTKNGALARFVNGPLPGKAPPKDAPPPSAPTPTGDGGAPPVVLPEVIDLGGPGSVRQGYGDVKYAGHVTKPTASFGVFLEGISTGYWVVPVTDLFDPAENATAVEAHFDFDRSITSARYRVLTVGFNDANEAGPQRVSGNPCVVSEVPDSFRGCNPKVTTVPEAVISLKWDTNVDLDLQVRTPSGRLVDPKHPTELHPNDAGTIPSDSAAIDRDSNAACAVDGARTENLVWKSGDAPEHGFYTVYANLFDACKQASVRFTVTLYLKSVLEDGGTTIEPFTHASGELLDFQANGGAGLGLYVAQFKL